VILAPVAEELFFRGLLLRGLWRSFGSRTAILVSAVVFGLSHFAGPTVQTVLPILATTALGLVLGWVFLRTRNLAVPVMVHVLQNALAVGLVLGGG
jgi:membrane protease YdiL (CAAX protease family)